MRALIVGIGNIGSVAAEDLARSVSDCEVVVSDKEEARARSISRKIGMKNVSWSALDATNRRELVKTFGEFDLAMGFLPGELGYGLLEACIAAGKPLVDASYMPENPLTLNDKAARAGVTIVPDCGLAPGISNVLIGNSAGKLDMVETVQIMVGGLPEEPVPPLGYVITWSAEGLIDEYTRKVVMVKEGKVVEVEALSGLEEVNFQGVGRLEAFYTDGLRTLLHTVRNAKEMCEKTLRYPGHAEKIGMLRDLGFFERDRVHVNGVGVSPRALTVQLLTRKLCKAEIRDIVALRVEVSGVKRGKRIRHVYHMLDCYDRERGITAMARTTAYPASIIAQFLLKEAMREKGVVPPEKIGADEVLFRRFLNELKKRGVAISEEETTD